MHRSSSIYHSNRVAIISMATRARPTRNGGAGMPTPAMSPVRLSCVCGTLFTGDKFIVIWCMHSVTVFMLPLSESQCMEYVSLKEYRNDTCACSFAFYLSLVNTLFSWRNIETIRIQVAMLSLIYTQGIRPSPFGIVCCHSCSEQENQAEGKRAWDVPPIETRDSCQTRDTCEIVALATEHTNIFRFAGLGM